MNHSLFVLPVFTIAAVSAACYFTMYDVLKIQAYDNLTIKQIIKHKDDNLTTYFDKESQYYDIKMKIYNAMRSTPTSKEVRSILVDLKHSPFFDKNVEYYNLWYATQSSSDKIHKCSDILEKLKGTGLKYKCDSNGTKSVNDLLKELDTSLG